MNYERVYKDLITSRKALESQRENNKQDYFERHHIIPSCMGGSNKKSNLVILTAREHFIAHALLVKMYPTNKGITNALICMQQNPLGNRYINNRLFEQLKKYWNQTHSGVNHHMFGKTHTEDARRRISEARTGTMPVKDAEGNIFCVAVDDPRVLSGELVHHSKGKKMTQAAYESYKAVRIGKPNPNANPVTDEQIIEAGVQFYKTQCKWVRKDWHEYCRANSLPIMYSRIRFDGLGYQELIRRIEAIVGPMKRFTKKDPEHRIKLSNLAKAKKRHWYHNDTTKETKLLSEDVVSSEWKLGRKTKWD